MSKRKAQPTGLPPFVRRHGSGFRAVFRVNLRRHYGPTFRTAEEAAAYASRHCDIRSERTEPPPILTVAGACSLLESDLERTGARPDTLAYYRKYCAVLQREWRPDRPLHEITHREIRLYISKRERVVAPQTLYGKELQVAGRLFRVAMTARRLHRDPMVGVQAPKMRRGRFEALDGDHVMRIVGKILASGNPSSRLHADIVLLLFLTGLRLAEVGRLRVRDYRTAGKSAVLFVDGKTENRYQPVPAALRPTIRRLTAGKQPDAALVGDGKRRLSSRVLELWKSRLRLAHFSAHVLRHSYATAMVRLGVDPFRLQVLMGHRSITQTQRYYHAASPDLQAAADLLGAQKTASRRTRARLSTARARQEAKQGLRAVR